MIRPARIEDTEEILTLIHELAVYEKAPEEAKATASQIQQSFFSDDPKVFCEIVEHQGEIAGFAICLCAGVQCFGARGAKKSCLESGCIASHALQKFAREVSSSRFSNDLQCHLRCFKNFPNGFSNTWQPL